MGDVGFAPLLIAFFVLGLGFAWQQLVAQPLLLLLSSEKTGSYRLALAGGVNSLGTLIGPVLIGKMVYADGLSELSIEGLQVLYYTLTGFFLVIMLALSTLRLPKITPKYKVINNSPRILIIFLFWACLVPFIFFVESVSEFWGIPKFVFLLGILFFIVGALIVGVMRGRRRSELWGVWAYERVPLGMLAIFFYVGTEVSIVSNFNMVFGPEGMMHGLKSDLVRATALYWGSLMVGRWMASVDILTQLPSHWRKLLYYVVGTLAFMVIVWVRSSFTEEAQGFAFAYLGVVVIFATLFVEAQHHPGRLLILLSTSGITTLIMGILSEGMLSEYAFIATGLACSVMWPCVFYLTLQKLGNYTAQASSLLVMMILGGALLPPLQGAITDMKEILGLQLSVRLSYLVPMGGFGYLLFFAIYMNWEKIEK